MWFLRFSDGVTDLLIFSFLIKVLVNAPYYRISVPKLSETVEGDVELDVTYYSGDESCPILNIVADGCAEDGDVFFSEFTSNELAYFAVLQSEGYSS